MSLPMAVEAAKFHMSLNVPDLSAAVGFYRSFFGIEPAKSHSDYAKFELEDPPVVVSLVPQAISPGASLRQLGFRVSTDAELQQFRDRVAAAGIDTESHKATTCRSASQLTFWVRDPFDNLWEVYLVDEEVGVSGPTADDSRAEVSIRKPAPVGLLELPVVWESTITSPLPDRVPHADSTVDEVRLTGSFNSDFSEAQRRFVVAESYRILKPGGKIVTHGLMGDRPFAGPQPKLPGLATMVARVPVQTEPIQAFHDVGFVGIQIVKYTEKAWFTHAGAELREVKIFAWKPGVATGESRAVMYKGPFREAVIDGGHVFPRGKRVEVSPTVWEQLRLQPTIEQFQFDVMSPRGGE